MVWVGVAIGLLSSHCGDCGPSNVGSHPPAAQVFHESTDSSPDARQDWTLLDLSGGESGWRQRATELWKPVEIQVDCAALSQVPALGTRAIDVRLGTVSTVQCVARPSERVEGRPVSARMVMVGSQIASASLIYPISEQEQRLTQATTALGPTEPLALEDRTDLVPTPLQVHLWMNDRDATALLPGRLSLELVHQNLRLLATLRGADPSRPASIDGLDIGSFKTTDTVELSTASQP